MAHALADPEHFRLPAGQVVEQAVHRGQSLIAGADVTTAIVLEMAQETHDSVESEIAQRQPGDLALLADGDEDQQ